MGKQRIKQSAATLTAEYIRRTVQKNGLMPGDSLPKEQDIASTLGISRPSVREGLKKLQVLGFIESRKKSGARVAKANPEEVLAEVIPSLAHTETQLAELDEFRAVIECGAVALAAMHRSDEELLELAAILKSGDRALEAKNYTAFSDADRQFHTKILRISRNPVLAAMGTVIRKRMSYLGNPARGSVIGDLAEEYRRSHYEHLEILSAIQQQDAVTGSTLMRFHTSFAMRQCRLSQLDTVSRKHGEC